MIKPTTSKAAPTDVEEAGSKAAPTLEDQARAEVQILTGAEDTPDLEVRVKALEDKTAGYERVLSHICGRMGVTLSGFLTE